MSYIFLHIKDSSKLRKIELHDDPKQILVKRREPKTATSPAIFTSSASEVTVSASLTCIREVDQRALKPSGNRIQHIISI